MTTFYNELSNTFDLYYQKYHQWCQTYIDPFLFKYLNFLTIVSNYCWIRFIDWLDITGIQNTSVPSVKWIVYTHLGQRYRIPIKKPRGPVERVGDDDFSTLGPKIYNEIVGPFDDYHGQTELLKTILPDL
jgi:hypothetical protein